MDEPTPSAGVEVGPPHEGKIGQDIPSSHVRSAGDASRFLHPLTQPEQVVEPWKERVADGFGLGPGELIASHDANLRW